MAEQNRTDPPAQESVSGKSLLKGRLVPIATLVAITAVTIGLFYIAQRYPEKIYEFRAYGYVGVFVVCLISNASVLLPVPGILIFIPVIGTLNPFLLGFVGATGGVFGEITGFLAGYSGRGIAPHGRLFYRVETWMHRWGIWAVFVLAAMPFIPIDIAGMVAGASRFPLWKFLLAVWLGKIIKYVAVAVGIWGFMGLKLY